MPDLGSLHHVELRTADLASAETSWEWILTELGYTPFQRWNAGRSWRLGHIYLVLEQASIAEAHDRRTVGLSHLAFHAGTTVNVDRLRELAPNHGWTPLYDDRYPQAGGPEHYAAYLENHERFKIELVAKFS